MSERRTVCILGATGSIGRSTLDLVERAPERFEVMALTAQRDVGKLAAAALRTRAKLAVIGDPALHDTLQDALQGSGIETAAGPAGGSGGFGMRIDWPSKSSSASSSTSRFASKIIGYQSARP